MAREDLPPERRDDKPIGTRGDAWSAFGYVVAGVFLYGLVGWALDRWWGTSFLVGFGVVIGAGLGTYQTWARFRQTDEHTQETP